MDKLVKGLADIWVEPPLLPYKPVFEVSEAEWVEGSRPLELEGVTDRVWVYIWNTQDEGGCDCAYCMGGGG